MPSCSWERQKTDSARPPAQRRKAIRRIRRTGTQISAVSKTSSSMTLTSEAPWFERTVDRRLVFSRLNRSFVGTSDLISRYFILNRATDGLMRAQHSMTGKGAVAAGQTRSKCDGSDWHAERCAGQLMSRSGLPIEMARTSHVVLYRCHRNGCTDRLRGRRRLEPASVDGIAARRWRIRRLEEFRGAVLHA